MSKILKSSLLTCYVYKNISIHKMIVNWPTYFVKYIAMILISSRMTCEISSYIEYNYPTEHI